MDLTSDIVTTVLFRAASYDMVDLATMKDELSMSGVVSTGDNAWLSRAISQVSRAVMNDTNRIFAPELLEDLFDVRRARGKVPSGIAKLQLSRWPVLAIMAVTQAHAGSVSPIPLVEDVDFRVDAENGQLLRLEATTGRMMAWEPLVVTVRYVAGFGVITQEMHTAPAAAPYIVTVGDAAAFSCDQSVRRSNGTELARVPASPAAGQYSVAAGVYTFNAADAGASLTFTYAIRDFPADLSEACLRLVSGRYRARGRDPALIQRDTDGIGTERFWFGGAPGQSGPFPPDIAGLLDNYRVPVVA